MHLNARALAIQGSDQAHENHGTDHAAQPAFHRLSGTDDRRQLVSAHRSADEIRPHVIDRAAQRDKDQSGKSLRPPPDFHRAVEEYGKHQCTGQDTPKADGMNLFHAAHKQREGHNGKHPHKQKDLRVIWNTISVHNILPRMTELSLSGGIPPDNGDGELMLTILASFAQEESRSISENVKWGTRKRFEQGIPNGKFQIYGYRWDGNHLVIEPEEAKIVKFIYDNFLNGLSAETTEKQLEAMGVKSYKGQHFGKGVCCEPSSGVPH